MVFKSLEHNEEFDKIVSRFPDNKKVCEDILDILNNKNTKIKEASESKDKTSLYIAISDTIIIGKIEDSFVRIQTIAHECIHSIQNRFILLFNFIFTNIYFLYFFVISLLTLFGINKEYNITLFVLIMMCITNLVVRLSLEINAMVRARGLAIKYMHLYNDKNNICDNKKIDSIEKEYSRVNKYGIPIYSLILLFKSIIKVIIYFLIIMIVK